MMHLSFRTSLTLGFLCALVVMVGFATRSLAYLDWVYLPDDTYYTLSIARNVALGAGPSSDGVIATTGFQPLIAFLEVPVFWLTGDLDLPVRVAIALSALGSVAATGFLGLIVFQATRSGLAALLAMIFAATLPDLVAAGLCGLEASLAAALGMALLWVLGRLPQEGAARTAFVAIGLLCGLALLARIDMAVPVGLAGLWMLARHGLGKTAIAVGVALAVVAPWWGWSIAHLGSPIPESGAAVRQIVAYHRSIGMTHLIAVAISLQTLTGIAGGAKFSGFGIAISLGAAGAVIYVLLRAWRGHSFGPLAILALTLLIHVAFYTFYLPAYWFFERYFVFGFYALIACTAVAATDLSRRIGRKAPARGWIPGIAVAGLIGFNLIALSGLWPGAREDWPRRPVQGYGETARSVIAALPDGAVLAAMQSGTLGYYAERGIRVINLDGVVNGRAAAAIAAGRLAAYLRQEGATHFADWDVNRAMLSAYSGLAPEAAEAMTIQIGMGPPQSFRRFVIYRLALPG